MATRAIANQITKTPNSLMYEWNGLLNGDDGTPAGVVGAEAIAFQLYGTLGAGFSTTLEGRIGDSLAPWAPLSDPTGGQGTPKTTAGLYTTLDRPEWVRPRVTAGDGTTNVSVRLMIRFPNR